MSKRNGIDPTAAEILRILDEAPDPPETLACQALQQAADAGDGGLRQEYLKNAQRHIARVDARRQPDIFQHLQAQALALQGRGGDTKIAHVTPNEVVIPARLQTPELMRAIYALAQAHGVDPRSLFVAGGHNRTNPRTGLMEFADEQRGVGLSSPGQEEQSIQPSAESASPLREPRSALIDLSGLDEGPSVVRGNATYYDKGGKVTANGEPFDKNASAAAMRKPVRMGDSATVQLQQPPYTTITVPINDRGPFAADSHGHTIWDENGHAMPHPTAVIDLTERAFRDLVGDTKLGHVPVTVTINTKSGAR